MGWFSNGIYGGDETQTCHLNFIKWAKLGVHEDEYYEWMKINKTVIPKEYRKLFLKNIDLVLKKIKTPKYWTEISAIDWQMLLALFVDNDIKPPRVVYKNGIIGTVYLMEEHASEFDVPSQRRRVLKNFIKKTNRLMGYE